MHQFAGFVFSHEETKFGFPADYNGCILVWDAKNYEAIGVPIQASASEWWIFLHADKVICRNSGTGQVCLWEIATGKPVAHYQLGGRADTLVDVQGALVVTRSGFGKTLTSRIAENSYWEDVTTKYSKA